MQKLVFLGVGQSALWVAQLAAGSRKLYGTTRDALKEPSLSDKGIEPIVIVPWSDHTKKKLSETCGQADVLVSFPPDGETDEELAPLCSAARSIIYISTTGVYGKKSGAIDEETEVDATASGALERLKAEKIWLAQGASVLRAPGLYDSQSGLHKRLLSGTYRLPGDGQNYVSRIHLKDLARIILACFEKPLPNRSVFLVGDLKPTTHKEIATWLCEQLNLPLPESAPLDEVAHTLRGNRQVSSKRLLQELGIELEFPTYQEGYAECLKQISTSAGTFMTDDQAKRI
jgi:dTDP-4-dehydrorhamnose reductase